jgi:DNA-binding transcriptional MerR regulator
MDDLLTTTQAAHRLGLSPTRIRQFQRAGRIRPARSFGRVLAYTRQDIDRFAAIKRPVGRPKRKKS